MTIVLQIEGAAINDIPSLYAEINRVFMAGGAIGNLTTSDRRDRRYYDNHRYDDRYDRRYDRGYYRSGYYDRGDDRRWQRERYYDNRYYHDRGRHRGW